jgi:hypothetical protein
MGNKQHSPLKPVIGFLGSTAWEYDKNRLRWYAHKYYWSADLESGVVQKRIMLGEGIWVPAPSQTKLDDAELLVLCQRVKWQ